MKLARRIGSSVFAASALAALVLGGLTVTSSPSHARPPVLLCGPTILWACSGPGGPDILFGGTLCEKAQFEKRTGLTCVPYGG